LFDIEIRKYKDVSLKNGVVIDGFPSIGLVSTISTSYLISNLNLDQVAVLDSEHFPPISMIYRGKPKFPARIYASEQRKIAVFSAEFTPNTVLNRAIGQKILSWANDHECKMIITIVGRPLTKTGDEKDNYNVVAVGSTEEANEKIEKSGIKKLDTGMIAGIPATLLNEGKWKKYDVIALLVNANKDIPDAGASVKILEAIGRLVPEAKVDLDPLSAEAKRIEEQLKSMRKEVASVQIPSNDMYG